MQQEITKNFIFVWLQEALKVKVKVVESTYCVLIAECDVVINIQSF